MGPCALRPPSLPRQASELVGRRRLAERRLLAPLPAVHSSGAFSVSLQARRRVHQLTPTRRSCGLVSWPRDTQIVHYSVPASFPCRLRAARGAAVLTRGQPTLRRRPICGAHWRRKPRQRHARHIAAPKVCRAQTLKDRYSWPKPNLARSAAA